MGGERDTVS